MRYYDTISKGYSELYASEQESKFVLLKDWLLSLKGLTLDLGAGIGLIQKYFKPSVSADLSIEMLNLNQGLRVCCDARALPFKDKSFDNLISFTMLQDIKAKNEVLSEIKRVCKEKVILTLLKRGKQLSSVKSILKDFKVLEFREHDKDYCFLLTINY